MHINRLVNRVNDAMRSGESGKFSPKDMVGEVWRITRDFFVSRRALRGKVRKVGAAKQARTVNELDRWLE